MSDIPIGSPPAPPGRHAAPSGWYPDPVDPRRERYWDGWQWSRNTRPLPGAQVPGPPPGFPGQLPPGPAQRPVAAVMTADGVPVASWWWRVLAVIVDFIITSIIAVIPSWSIYARLIGGLTDYVGESLRAAEAGQAAPPSPGVNDLISFSDQFTLSLITVGVNFVYVVLFWRLRGATPGKLLCGLRVVPVDQGTNTRPLPWLSVILRGVVWAAPGLTGYLWLFQALDVLFPLWQPKRQAIHDLVAKTQVVKIR